MAIPTNRPPDDVKAVYTPANRLPTPPMLPLIISVLLWGLLIVGLYLFIAGCTSTPSSSTFAVQSWNKAGMTGVE